MVANDIEGNLTPRVVLGFIASRLAPTGNVFNDVSDSAIDPTET